MKSLFLLTAKYAKMAQRNAKGGNLFSAALCFHLASFAVKICRN